MGPAAVDTVAPHRRSAVREHLFQYFVRAVEADHRDGKLLLGEQVADRVYGVLPLAFGDLQAREPLHPSVLLQVYRGDHDILPANRYLAVVPDVEPLRELFVNLFAVRGVHKVRNQRFGPLVEGPCGEHRRERRAPAR